MAQCILALCSQRDSVELSIDLVAGGQFEAPPWVKKVRTLGESRRENASVRPQLECQLKEERRCPCTVIASAAKQSRIPPRKDSGLLRCARNDEMVESRVRPLLRGRADRVELVAEEDAARVGHDGHDGERDTGGDQAILDRGGAILIGKKRPEQSHRQLLFIRFNVCSRRYQIGKLIDQAFARIKNAGSADLADCVLS